MWYQRTGLPEEDDIVLCTVKTVQYHSVFVTMDHFAGKSGMIHISEVSPGRIRNIRDYVVEGKKVWCKVLRVNLEKGHVDLSLRRVNESQKRIKNDAIKQEQRAEKIIELYALEIKMPPEEAYKKIAPSILQEYEFIHEAFNAVIEDGASLEAQGIPAADAALLHKLIKEKITPKRFEIGGIITLKTFDEHGLIIVKDILAKAASINPSVSLKYSGGGTYAIRIISTDVKGAENLLKKVLDVCKTGIEVKKGVFDFKKKETQKAE
jgi:translation initiation factor 2 subunit 1